MPIEIERRFLVCNDEWRAEVASSLTYRQSYLSRTSESNVRVRRSDDYATIAVKGPRDGLARREFEYAIPMLHADYMLSNMCVTPIIEKVRHWVDHAGMTWEVDVYCGDAAGLVLAEVELERIDQPVVMPHWVGADVTYDLRYRSSGIVQGLWRSPDSRLAKIRHRAPRRRTA
jgi:adenylate cyclase